MVRRAALFALVAAPLLALSSAQATGGIQVSPVLVTMSTERGITSIRLRNGRDRPTSFEIDAYAWSQNDGRDVVEPTTELIVAPAVFEIEAQDEQIIRLGAQVRNGQAERSYRIIMRELPRTRSNGATLGFTLEMSLPVFVAPADVSADLNGRLEQGALILTNSGRAHVQIAGVEAAGEAVDAPRYLLAGANVRVPVPAQARTIRVRLAGPDGRTTHLDVHAHAQSAGAAGR